MHISVKSLSYFNTVQKWNRNSKTWTFSSNFFNECNALFKLCATHHGQRWSVLAKVSKRFSTTNIDHLCWNIDHFLSIVFRQRLRHDRLTDAMRYHLRNVASAWAHGTKWLAGWPRIHLACLFCSRDFANKSKVRLAINCTSAVTFISDHASIYSTKPSVKTPDVSWHLLIAVRNWLKNVKSLLLTHAYQKKHAVHSTSQ